VQSDQLEEHRFYAYRVNHRARGSELLKVKLLAKVGRGGKVKVRYEDGPHPGLEEYVRTMNLIVPWGERKALQRDEERHRLLDEYTRRARRDPAVAEAVSSVLASSGEPSAYAAVEGVSMREEELERIMRRAGLEGEPTSLHRLAFRDRFGEVHVPLDGAEPLARAFAAAEPETVLMYLSDQESELKYRGYQAGDHYLHDLLRQYSPGWALARQWAGFEQEVEQLKKEIGRLRQLITRAAYELRDAGADQKSRRLLRALDGS
jgi:hypothetical protein